MDALLLQVCEFRSAEILSHLQDTEFLSPLSPASYDLSFFLIPLSLSSNPLLLPFLFRKGQAPHGYQQNMAHQVSVRLPVVMWYVAAQIRLKDTKLGYV